MEKKTLLLRCKEFFGLKPGQTLLEFKNELAALTVQDRADLARYFEAAGMPTNP